MTIKDASELLNARHIVLLPSSDPCESFHACCVPQASTTSRRGSKPRAQQTGSPPFSKPGQRTLKATAQLITMKAEATATESQYSEPRTTIMRNATVNNYDYNDYKLL